MSDFDNQPADLRPPTLEEMAAAAAAPPGGSSMECPRCGCKHFLTNGTDNRRGRVRRYRYCRHCGHGVITDERIVRDVEMRKPAETPAAKRLKIV